MVLPLLIRGNLPIDSRHDNDALQVAVGDYGDELVDGVLAGERGPRR